MSRYQISHDFRFSILGGHIKNAEREVKYMKSIKGLRRLDLNYGEKEKKIYTENIQHGILAIYSINSALETLVALIIKDLGYNTNKFYRRVKILKNKNIITDIDNLKKCLDLRDKRNIITHWEKDGFECLGTNGHILFMLGDRKPRKNVEKLISILSKDDLDNYLESFNKLIDNILESNYVSNQDDLSYSIKIFREGSFELGY